MEISDNELIAEMAKTGKPIIISTGVANERYKGCNKDL